MLPSNILTIFCKLPDYCGHHCNILSLFNAPTFTCRLFSTQSVHSVANGLLQKFFLQSIFRYLPDNAVRHLTPSFPVFGINMKHIKLVVQTKIQDSNVNFADGFVDEPGHKADNRSRAAAEEKPGETIHL